MDVVLVNWNAGPQLAEAVTSIAQHHHNLVSSVIIIDNASIDDSLAQVEAFTGLPFQLQIIRNADNRGFGAACNQGAAVATEDYLLFLNPDTCLLADSLSVPLSFMEQPENTGVGICSIQLLDESGRVARSCARFPSLGIFLAQVLGLNKLPWFRSWGTHMSEWDHAKTREVDHVIGAFYLVRRSLFESLGGFDERFFVYLEDLDFSLRARQAGWRTVYLTEAQAFHAGGGTSRQVKARRLFYSLRSRLLYGFKHFSKLNAWLLLLITITVEPCTRLALALLRRSSGEASNTLSAYRMLLTSIPRIIIKYQEGI
ncbi:glycosyltransferase family 2 protein [Patescibacteria group bacterium]|nr:glycosyltransferase family 2 protein [Patescibacteria group bacterium]